MYCGVGLYGSSEPPRLTFSWRFASLLARWNAVAVVLAMLSLSLHDFRYSEIAAMSDVRTSSALDQLASEKSNARSSA